MSEASIDEQDQAQFRADVVRYLTLPELIKQADEQPKQLKAELKELEHNIADFMKQHNIDRCNIPDEIGGGLLVPKTSTTKTPVKKEHYKTAAETFFKKRGIDATYEEIEKEIEDLRDYQTKNALKRIKR